MGMQNSTIRTLINLHIDEFSIELQKLLYRYIDIVESNAHIQIKELINLGKKKQIRQKPQVSTKADDTEIPRIYKEQVNEEVKKGLEQRPVTTSKYVTETMSKEVQQILSTSETEGLGNKEVARRLRKKFQQLKGYQARRIARTEINAVNNEYAYQQLVLDDTVDYKQWIATHDHRTRESHQELDGEITRVADPFSNGLLYPGDHRGAPKEFINCRCTVVPYYVDWNKVAPDKKQFHEQDLQERPADEGIEIKIELDENDRILQAMEGYVNIDTTFIHMHNGGSTTSTPLTKYQNLNEKEALDYEKLYKKLIENGGSIGVTPGTTKIIINKGDSNLNLKEIIKLKKLYNKEYTPSKGYDKSSINVTPDVPTEQNRLLKLKGEQETLEREDKKYTEIIEKIIDKENTFNSDSVNIYDNKITQLQNRKKSLNNKLKDVKIEDIDVSKLKGDYLEYYNNISIKIKSGEKLSLLEKKQWNTVLKLSNKNRKKYLDEIKEIDSQLQAYETKKTEISTRVRESLIKARKDFIRERSKTDEKLYENYVETETSPHTKIHHNIETYENKEYYSYDAIEDTETDYRTLSIIYNSYKNRNSTATDDYTGGSSHFNSYIVANKNKDKKELDNLFENMLKLKQENLIGDKYKKVMEEYPDTWRTEQIKIWEKTDKGLKEDQIPLKENTILFSGQNYMHYKQYHAGDKIEVPTYFSSTVSKQQTDFFVKKWNNERREGSPCIFKIYADKGTNTIAINERSTGAYDHEAEFIFPPNSKFEVDHVTKEYQELLDEKVPVFYVRPITQENGGKNGK